MGNDDAAAVQIQEMKERQDRHEKASVREHGEMWDAIAELRKLIQGAMRDAIKQAPTWTTAAISLLSFFLGSALTVIVILVKVAL